MSSEEKPKNVTGIKETNSPSSQRLKLLTLALVRARA